MGAACSVQRDPLLSEWVAYSLDTSRVWMRVRGLPESSAGPVLEQLFHVTEVRTALRALDRERQTIELRWGSKRMALVTVVAERTELGEHDLQTVRVSQLPAILRTNWTPVVPRGWEPIGPMEWNVYSCWV